MTQNQLKKVMKFQLGNFNDEGVKITDDTLHSEILSPDDGFGRSNSKDIYKNFIRWTFRRNGQKDKPWPSNWISQSVSELSANLL